MTQSNVKVMDVIHLKLVKIFAAGHELRLNDESPSLFTTRYALADNEGRSVNVRHSGRFSDSSLGFVLP